MRCGVRRIGDTRLAGLVVVLLNLVIALFWQGDHGLGCWRSAGPQHGSRCSGCRWQAVEADLQRDASRRGDPAVWQGQERRCAGSAVREMERSVADATPTLIRANRIARHGFGG